MAIRKLKDRNICKILKSGDSYAVTIPIEMIDKLKWREKQKVVVKGPHSWGMFREPSGWTFKSMNPVLE